MDNQFDLAPRVNQPTPPAAASESTSIQPMFFSVSPFKLMVMCFCTVGMYEVYWFYKNWKSIKARNNENISPAVRAIFSGFFVYGLFDRVRRQCPESSASDLKAGLLATSWILLSLMQRLPYPYELLCFLSIFMLWPAQVAINEINRIECDNIQLNETFSAWNWGAIFIGGLLVVLFVIGSFVGKN